MNLPEKAATPIQLTGADWLKQFDVERISDPKLQRSFRKFLGNRAADYEFYQSVPEAQFDQSIVEGSDSPRKELIHVIAHTRLRSEGLRTGNVPDYKVKVVHPEWFTELEGQSREQLLTQLGQVTQELLDIFTKPDITNKRITVPFEERPLEPDELLADIRDHQSLHVGLDISRREIIAGSAPESRLPGVKKIWG